MANKFSKEADIAKDLSTQHLKDLIKLAAEPDGKDTMTLGEFNRAMGKWRKGKQFAAELDNRYEAMETGKDKGFTVEQLEASIAKLRTRRNKF